MTAQVPQVYPWMVWPAVLLACAVLDSLYCGMETGIYVLNKIRLDLHAEAGRPSARRLQRLLRDPNRLLVILLLGTNITRYLATFSISAMFVMGGAGRNAHWYTLAVAAPVMFVLHDAVPKQVFQRLSEGVVYGLTRLLRVSEVLLTLIGLAPLVGGVIALLLRATGAARRPGGGAGLQHPGLLSAIAEGRASGLITHFQSAMADRVMHIADVKLADVMKPMADVLAAPREITRDQLIELVRDHDYSRIPLLSEAGAVEGILDIYEVLADDEAAPREKMTPPLVLPDRAPVTDTLHHMQRAHAAMAVVHDVDNRHVGIVTLKDLLEEIVGELEAW